MLSDHFTFYFIQLPQFFSMRGILIQIPPSQTEMEIPYKYSPPPKCTRWYIFLFDKNVFLLAFNLEDNLMQNKILGSQTPFSQNSVGVGPYSFCM